jgi:hypothetical protein
MRVFADDAGCHNKPLWFVYGVNCFPSIICCTLKKSDDDKIILWGFSIYKRSPGFRTLGVEVNTWVKRQKDLFGHELFEFYDDHEQALDRIRKLTTPKHVK